MNQIEFDPALALGTLCRHGVRFVIIGGIAANLRGSPSATYDLDICYARDPDNLRRLAKALMKLNARLRGAPEGLPFRLDGSTLRSGDHFTFMTSAGALDCIGIPSGSSGFDELAAKATEHDLENARVLVASLDDLLRMKRAVGRPKDRIEVEVLEALRDELAKPGGDF